MYHYTYKLELPETGEYYFGSRSCSVEPIKDTYMGSMKSWKPDKSKLIKTIIKDDFNNRIDCISHERELIINSRNDFLNKNACIPGVGFNTLGLGQYVNSSGKVYRVDKSDELVLNGTLKPFWNGRKHTEESKLKMSNAKIGKKLSIETRKKMSEYHIHKPKSEQTKIKMRNSAMGDNNNYKRFLERTGLPHAKSKPIFQYNLDGTFIQEWVNAHKASLELNLSYKAINSCLNGKCKTSQGFIWKYKEIVIDTELEAKQTEYHNRMIDIICSMG